MLLRSVIGNTNRENHCCKFSSFCDPTCKSVQVRNTAFISLCIELCSVEEICVLRKTIKSKIEDTLSHLFQLYITLLWKLLLFILHSTINWSGFKQRASVAAWVGIPPTVCLCLLRDSVSGGLCSRYWIGLQGFLCLLLHFRF